MLMKDVDTESDYIQHVIDTFDSHNFKTDQQISICRDSTLTVIFNGNLADIDFAAALISALRKSKKESSTARESVSIF